MTVSNISTTITFTASYSNVSDTCTVTVQTYLFYDDVSSDRSNEYTNASIQRASNTNYLALTYNSAGYYTMQASANEGNHYAKWIPVLTGEDNLKFSCEVMTNSLNGNNRFGIVVGDSSAYKSERFQITNQMVERQIMIDTTETKIEYSPISSLSANTWYRMEWTIQGTSFTFNLKDMNDNTLYTKTGTFTSTAITSATTKRYGLYYLNYYPNGTKYYRNIKVEPI